MRLSSARHPSAVLVFLLTGVGLVGCGASSHPPTTGARATTSSVAATTVAPPPSVTAQPATTTAPAVGPGMPLGSTQSATTSSGHVLGVVVTGVMKSTPTQVQVRVELTADGPPATIHPAEDFHLIDASGAQHGASLVATPSGCPSLSTVGTVTAQAPVIGCVVFTVPAATTPAGVTFRPDGTSTTLTWRAS